MHNDAKLKQCYSNGYNSTTSENPHGLHSDEYLAWNRGYRDSHNKAKPNKLNDGQDCNIDSAWMALYL